MRGHHGVPPHAAPLHRLRALLPPRAAVRDGALAHHVHLLLPQANYSDALGWNGAGAGPCRCRTGTCRHLLKKHNVHHCHGLEGLQGFLFYYFVQRPLMQAHAGGGAAAATTAAKLSSCHYNTQIRRITANGRAVQGVCSRQWLATKQGPYVFHKQESIAGWERYRRAQSRHHAAQPNER